MWFTLDNRGGPIWASRGREFKSRQPDRESPSGSGFAGLWASSPRPWIRHRFRNISRSTGQSGSESTGSGSSTLSRRTSDIDIHRVPNRGAASTGGSPARSIATASSVRVSGAQDEPVSGGSGLLIFVPSVAHSYAAH
jgi:hypothetical protein